MAEAAYRRYCADGDLQVETTFDAHEKFHDDEKCYDHNGKHIVQYRHDHGNTLIPVFETHLMKVERLWKMQQGPEPYPSRTSQKNSMAAPPRNSKTALKSIDDAGESPKLSSP